MGKELTCCADTFLREQKAKLRTKPKDHLPRPEIGQQLASRFPNLVEAGGPAKGLERQLGASNAFAL